MNTYPEHQVTTFVLALCSVSAVYIVTVENLSCPFTTGCHRYRQDYLLTETADPGPAGSHGQPHKLRPLPSV